MRSLVKKFLAFRHESRQFICDVFEDFPIFFRRLGDAALKSRNRSNQRASCLCQDNVCFRLLTQPAEKLQEDTHWTNTKPRLRYALPGLRRQKYLQPYLLPRASQDMFGGNPDA